MTSPEFKSLVMALLTADQEARLTLDELSKHQWMAEGAVPQADEIVAEMDKKYEVACLEGAEI